VFTTAFFIHPQSLYKTHVCGLKLVLRDSWLNCLYPSVDSYKYIQYETYLDQSYMNVENGDMKESQRITPVLHKYRVGPNRLHYTGTAKRYGAGYCVRYSDSLRVGRSGDRIPGWGDIPHPSILIPKAHTAFYVTGTGSFLGIKWTERGVNQLPFSSAEVMERVEVNLYSPFVPSWCVTG
jgi:hypothetical protein